jgi:hypothetical protein
MAEKQQSGAQESRPGPTDLTLEQLDGDGAIQESIAELYGHSRAAFLRKAVVGSATLLALLAEAPPLLGARPSKENDVHIFQYALNFEYLQATFYTETERAGTVTRMAAPKAFWARTLGAHERAHVKIIKHVLGAKATKKPFFDFHGNTEDEDRFTRTAVAMEDLTTALLTGVTPSPGSSPSPERSTARNPFPRWIVSSPRHASSAPWSPRPRRRGSPSSSGEEGPCARKIAFAPATAPSCSS